MLFFYIKLILFSLIKLWLVLFKKNGHVAPKSGSAKINIVVNINNVSKFENKKAQKSKELEKL